MSEKKWSPACVLKSSILFWMVHRMARITAGSVSLEYVSMYVSSPVETDCLSWCHPKSEEGAAPSWSMFNILRHSLTFLSLLCSPGLPPCMFFGTFPCTKKLMRAGWTSLEYAQKPWNHYKTYLKALEMVNHYEVSLFSAAVKVDWIFLINNH